jgi:hypothetical protein
VRTTEDIPDRDGWTGGKQIIYETSPNERVVMAAIARRAWDNWSVVLLDGSEPTFEKRGSQIGLVVGSLRPKDYQRESFAGRKPLPLTSERIETLRSFVETSMKKLDVPGAGFALIDQGKVVYEGGISTSATGCSCPMWLMKTPALSVLSAMCQIFRRSKRGLSNNPACHFTR